MSDEYYDIDGNKVSLDELCRTEPAWAANVIRTQQSQLRTLAEVVLVAHKGKGGICADCPHVEYGEDYQRCKGGEYDCCKCQPAAGP